MKQINDDEAFAQSLKKIKASPWIRKTKLITAPVLASAIIGSAVLWFFHHQGENQVRQAILTKHVFVPDKHQILKPNQPLIDEPFPGGTVIYRVDGLAGGSGCNISPNGKIVVIAARPGHIILDLEKNVELFHIAYQGEITPIFTPDSRFLVTGGTNVQIWDLAKGELLQEYPHGYPPDGSVTAIAISTDGSRLATVQRHLDPNSSGYNIRIWEAKFVRIIQKVLVDTEVARVAFGPTDQTLLFWSTVPVETRIVDLTTGTVTKKKPLLPFLSSSQVRRLPQGPRILGVSGEERNCLVLANPEDGAVIQQYRTKYHKLLRCIWSIDGKKAAFTVDEEGQQKLHFFDLVNSQDIGYLSGAWAKEMGIVMLPDGNSLLSIDDQSTVKKWDLTRLKK